MEKEKRYELKISGIGSSGGGNFKNVVIDGNGKVYGDVDCIDIRINGIGSVHGNVTSVTGKINGKGSIKGSLKSDQFKVSGNADIDGNVEVKEIALEGMINIKGSVSAERIEIRGGVRINENCDTEAFISKGSFTIGGLLNAGIIEMDLYAPCKAKEIGGEKISVKKGSAFSLRRLIKSIFPVLDINTGLSAEVVEGDDIYLEFTRAKVVRGNNVIIGPGCEIELVEYKCSFDKSDKAEVKQSMNLK